MKSFETFWEECLNSKLILPDDPDITAIKQAVEIGYLHGIAAFNAVETEELEQHNAKMKTDPAYKERFDLLSIEPGRKITVGMTCFNQYQSQKLMSSLYSKDQVLVAGCRVERIDFTDISSRFETLKTEIKKLVDTV